ncbi:MAG: hypothetical protein Q9206_001458 [Seirophora lacunosa]
MDDGRVKAFRMLKPPCVELSQVALRYKVNKTTAKELLPCLERLKAILQLVGSSLDPKLADYAFFPLSHIFSESKKLPSRVLELALHCLRFLILQGWQAHLSSELGKQLLVLLAFLSGGSATDAKTKDVDEDVGTVAFDCTTGLLQSSLASSFGTRDSVKPENIPLLGHTVTVMLDGISNGPATKVRLAACSALNALVAGIHDREALKNVFPGIVSCLTKVLSSGIRSRTPYKILEACIYNLEQVLCKVLGHTDSLPLQSSLKTSPEATKLSKSWLDATRSQVKMALSSIVVLRYHDRQEVLDALFSLCFSALTICRSTLTDCAQLMVETLTALSSHSPPEDTSQQGQQLRLQQLLASDPDLVDNLREALRDSIIALPRVVGANDEIKRRRLIEQLSTAFRLLSAQHFDLIALNDLTVSALVSSVATAVQTSSTSTIRSVADGSAEVGRVLQAATSSAKRREFVPIAFDSTSQAGLMAGLQSLIRQLQGLEQMGSLWLTLQMFDNNSIANPKTDQWLDLPREEFDPLEEEAYSFALGILGQSAYDDTVDWRLQALSLEMVALQARFQAKDFRPELVDTLYPILERMGSSNVALQQHAVTCLSIVSNACGYPSASELVTENADYLVNAVAMKLSEFDISPQASQVMLMMIRLCGSPLIPYLDDLIESIFAILADYHGYPRLVEPLFEVLNAVVEEAGKSYPHAIESGSTGTAPKRRQPYKPPTITDLISHLQSMDSKSSAPSSTLPNESDPEPEKDAPPPTTTDEPPPLSKTHSLIRTITLQTTHHLSSPSPTLRRLLLTLLTTSLPTLATQTPTDTFLPLLATLWPHIINPVLSTSPSSPLKSNDLPTLLAALTALATACEHGGSFLLSRIEDSFPAIRTLYEHLERACLLEEKQLGRSRASRSLKFKCWDACVGLVVVMVEYVGVTREMEDDVFELLGGLALERGRVRVRECLEGVNPDSLWLLEERRRGKRQGGGKWKKPVIQGWDFRDVEF